MNFNRLFIKKIILVLSYFDKLGFAGLKLLFVSLYGQPGLRKIKHRKLPYPVYFRNRTSDIPTFNQCILQEHYNISVDFEPKVIFDLGANIGLSAVYFKSRWPESKIYCVEPAVENYKILLKNTERFSGVKCFNNGIWCKNTGLVVENIDNAGNWGFTVRESSDESGMEAITIKKLMEINGVDQIDLLKIDVEGSEFELFDQDCHYWLSRTSILVIELHDILKPGSSRAMFRALSNYDYSTKTLGESIICYLNRLDRPKSSKVKVF